MTGSGRLDLYQKGGDSLLGRYFLYRMHPLSCGEITDTGKRTDHSDPDDVWQLFVDDSGSEGDLEDLLLFGGFPEPFLRGNKSYFWDWSETRDEAARFENMVMPHLRKACHTWTDFGLGEFELWYIRDKEKREIDALITRDGQPWLAAEVKLNETEVSSSLRESTWRTADTLPY